MLTTTRYRDPPTSAPVSAFRCVMSNSNTEPTFVFSGRAIRTKAAYSSFGPMVSPRYSPLVSAASANGV